MREPASSPPMFLASLQKIIPLSIFALLFLPLGLLGVAHEAMAIGQERYVERSHRPGSFAIARHHRLATIYVDANDHWGVVRAAHDLQQDISRVTDRTPEITNRKDGIGPNGIIIGTVGKSALIDELVASGKLDVTAIRGKWEFFLIEVVQDPVPGVQSALVIAGSDKRGTIFGI